MTEAPEGATTRDLDRSGAQSDPFRLIGKMLDDAFRVDEFVAQGGFGTVYRGWQTSIARSVALKCSVVASADRALGDADATSREARIIGQLQPRHSAIVQVFAQGVTTAPTGVPIRYIVMEWLEGEPLSVLLESSAELLAAGRFTEARAIELLRPAIEAIAAAHRQDPPIVHRDLKPSNLFVLSAAHDVRIKVLDFGSAKTAPTADARRALTTLGQYTPAYAAPEQATRGLGAIGPWSDVFALAVILEEMVLGQAALQVVPDAVSDSRCALRSDLSEAFRSVSRRALSRHSEQRYRDAGELLEALDAVVNPKQASRVWLHVAAACGVFVLAGVAAAGWMFSTPGAAPSGQESAQAPALSGVTGTAILIAAHDAGQERATLEPPRRGDVEEPAQLAREPELVQPEQPVAAFRPLTASTSHGPKKKRSTLPPEDPELVKRAQRVVQARQVLAGCANVEPDWLREICKKRESAALKSRQEEYDLVAPTHR